MSKRFGRNQKRKLLSEIARLKQEVDNATIALIVQQMGEYAPATGCYPSLSSLVDHIGDREVTNSRRRGQIRRSARVTVWTSDCGYRLMDAMYGLVEWEGICWKVETRSVCYDHYDHSPEIELELEAIGSGASYRKESYILSSSDTQYNAAELISGERRFFKFDPRPTIEVKSRPEDLYQPSRFDEIGGRYGYS